MSYDRILWDPALRPNQYPTLAQRRQAEEHGRILLERYAERQLKEEEARLRKLARYYYPYSREGFGCDE